MAKTRVFFLILTFVVVGFLGYFGIQYAKGYRLDIKTLKILPRGILVVKTVPTGAEILVNGVLKGASDTNLPLAPGNYDVEIKKEGFIGWYKRLTIEKETVIQIDVSLFRAVPSLSPVTINGAFSPVLSNDLNKIAYADNTGLWLIETLNFPIGFNKEPKKVTDGDLTPSTSLGTSWQFSPSGNEILLTSAGGVFLLDAGSFTPQAKRVNIASQEKATILSWQKENETRLLNLTKNLPEEVQDLLQRRALSVAFSPDETRILYTASSSGTLSSNLIKPLPGASTQKEDRDIKIDHTYVYDIKEDRNFLIDQGLNPINQRLFWLHNSTNLVLTEEGKVTIMDFDGTNRQVVFSGGYVAPNVFPYVNTGKLLILTNLGATSSPNLYSISIK